MGVLRVQDLKKSFWKGFVPKKHSVLNGVSFQLNSGSITGFLGANGAGKTTTLKCILGLAFPDAGHVHFFGGEALSSGVKQRIGFLPERPYFYDYLTGYELLFFYGSLTQKIKKNILRDRILLLLKQMDLMAAKDLALRSYSKGMLQKLGLAQALLHEPELLILDEPMSGLDPDGRLAVAEMIREIAKKEASVFFSSHLLNDVESLCDDLVIIKRGRVVYQGGVEQLLKETGSGYRVTFFSASDSGGEIGRELNSVVLETKEGLQKELDRLRKGNLTIHEVQFLHPSLEEVFGQVGLERGDSCIK